jgi:hypothetical protein
LTGKKSPSCIIASLEKYTCLDSGDPETFFYAISSDMEEQELADHVAEMVAAQVAQQLQLLGVQGNPLPPRSPPLLLPRP